VNLFSVFAFDFVKYLQILIGAHIAQKISDRENSGVWGHPCPIDTFLVVCCTAFIDLHIYICVNKIVLILKPAGLILKQIFKVHS
jgi:hypothetical protein